MESDVKEIFTVFDGKSNVYGKLCEMKVELW